jgi:hypothetical protein
MADIGLCTVGCVIAAASPSFPRYTDLPGFKNLEGLTRNVRPHSRARRVEARQKVCCTPSLSQPAKVDTDNVKRYTLNVPGTSDCFLPAINHQEPADTHKIKICPAPDENKAELSSLPAQTKLMPSGYKAELSSSPAQTKFMPFGYKKSG